MVLIEVAYIWEIFFAYGKFFLIFFYDGNFFNFFS